MTRCLDGKKKNKRLNKSAKPASGVLAFREAGMLRLKPSVWSPACRQRRLCPLFLKEAFVAEAEPPLITQLARPLTDFSGTSAAV